MTMLPKVPPGAKKLGLVIDLTEVDEAGPVVPSQRAGAEVAGVTP